MINPTGTNTMMTTPLMLMAPWSYSLAAYLIIFRPIWFCGVPILQAMLSGGIGMALVKTEFTDI